MDWNRRDLGTNKKSATLTVLLVALSLIGPAVAYAGVDVVWPQSTNHVDINRDPPIQFDSNSTGDFGTAHANNFTGNWTGTNNNASYSVTVSGLSGGNVTIDSWLNLSVKDAVSSFDMEITDNNLTNVGPTTLEGSDVNFLGYRVWDPDLGSAPATNNSASVLCWVNLQNQTGHGTATNDASGACELPTNQHNDKDSTWRKAHVQVVVDLESDLTMEQADIGLQPLNITFA